MLSSPVLTAFAVLAAGLLAVSALRVVVRAAALHRERTAMAERIRQLEAEEARLGQASGALDAPETVERLAKERLNLKNPGEEVVVVTAIPASASAETGGRARLIPSWLGELLQFLRR